MVAHVQLVRKSESALRLLTDESLPLAVIFTDLVLTKENPPVVWNAIIA